MMSPFFVINSYLWKCDLVGLLQVVGIGDDEVMGWDVLDSDCILSFSSNHAYEAL